MESRKKNLVSAFLEVAAAGCSRSTAKKFLKASKWNIDEALQLYFSSDLDNDEQQETMVCPPPPPPLPVIRETLYDQQYHPHPTDYQDLINSRFWDSDLNSDRINHEPNHLANLYRPPLELMFCGSFEEAKVAAAAKDRWLLVNLQSSEEFDSHVMNRDLWSDKAVVETIRSFFLFWQVENHTMEGMKICSFYKLDSFPVILVIDPITGLNMCSSKGLIKPENLLMDLLPPFIDIGPKCHIKIPFCHKHKLESTMIKEEEEEEQEKQQEKQQVYPPLPEEPMGDRNLVCRVIVRLPDGRRYQRSFLREDPIQLLWSFCYLEIEEAKMNPFGLTVAIPGASKRLDYDSELTFDKSGISNSIISLTWE